ncbi:MAG: FUSC family protein [Aliidongia sp.]
MRGGDASTLRDWQAEMVKLIELRERAGMFDHGLRRLAGLDGSLIEALAEIGELWMLLPEATPIEARLPLAEACEACASALERDEAVSPLPLLTEAVLQSLTAEERPIVVAIAQVLGRLADGIARRRTATVPPAPSAAKALFVPDAFSNPSHVRFALKTTIAVMAAYVIYSGLDWPGISTSVTTCFFVALGSLGETMHKLTLRLAGAAIGGLAGALCIVYLLPEMTDIGQLCLLIGVAAAACAWVATSSELLSYAGMQIAFAFFLGVLQDYGPSTDLTVLRDRVAGILLGNILMSVVFSTLWPTSAADRARAAVAKALRMLGGLLGAEGAAKAGARLAVILALVDARKYAGLASFELRLLPVQAERRRGLDLAPSLDRLAGATFAVIEQPPDVQMAELALHFDAALSGWFAACAERVVAGAAWPALPAAILADAPPRRSSAIEVRQLLQSEIENAVAVPV